MGENKITREVYKHYANRIVDVLKNEDFYDQFKKRVDKGSASFKLAKKRLIQDISIDWIDTIESILPNLDTIVRNPRKFIVQEEDIVDVSLARSISTESVKYLAQHTNMISKVDKKTGDVTPSKILNITKEESFEIYENRFIYTLLLKLKDFVTMRYDKIKKATATQDVLELDVESRFNLPSKKVTYRTEYFAQLSFDEIMRLDPDTLTKIERVAKIDRIITDFLSSSFAKSMRNSAPVRPPIMRTNVILKEPNFKKALVLWQFVETYQATGGFSTSDEVEELTLEDDSQKKLREMVTLNTMLFESMYDQFETDLNMEDKEFADILRIGQMDFEKDKLERDEFSQKLDDQKENEDEQDNVEEVKPQEDDKADTEIPPEKEPEVQEVEKPVEIIKEVVVERPVEVERLKEMPPKADQEEVDLEPDAEKFDQHLFEVRKLYKRPDDDKLKQEDLIKVRDAIDRCLTSYRRIKQEELDDRERKLRIRKRKEDIEKRAAQFKQQRVEIEQSGEDSDVPVYFGMDPFAFQKAKIAENKRKEEERKNKIKYNKHEHLELDDSSTDDINKAIEEMEKDRAKRKVWGEKVDRALEGLSVDDNKQKDANSAQNGVEGVENAQSTADSAKKPKKRRGFIRLSKSKDIDPWKLPTSEHNEPHEYTREFKPVDENKVQVGDIHLKDGSHANDWGANTGLGGFNHTPTIKVHHDEPIVQEKPIEEPKAEVVEEKVVEQPIANEPVDQEEVKAPIKRVATPKYSVPSGKNKTFNPVDENKVAVGGIHFADGTSFEDPYGMFHGAANKAETGHIEVIEEEPESVEPPKPRKPRKPRAKKVDKVEEPKDSVVDAPIEEPAPVEEPMPVDKKVEEPQVADTPVETPQSEPETQEPKAETPVEEVKVEEPKKPKKPRKDKNALSDTTLNQKYSKPSGKNKVFNPVDENKVGVGGFHFSDGTSIDDPFGGMYNVTQNKAESYEDEE